MTGIVVALVLQVAWQVVRWGLERGVLAARDPQIAGLSFGLTFATYLVIAAAAAELSRRLTGRRRIGVRIAAAVYAAMAIGLALYEGLLYRGAKDSVAHAWLVAMHDYGWGALEVAAIVGFAIAAGRRGAWLAPPAVATALLAPPPHEPLGAWQLADVIGFAVLLVLMTVAADRHATVAAPAPERAVRGLRRIELLAWLAAGMSIVGIAPSLTMSSMYVAVAWSSLWIAIHVVFVSAAWSVANANIATLPRWLWYASAACALWAIARSVRIWFLTITRYWSRPEEARIVTLHWWNELPALLAMIAALVSLAVFARRSGSRELVHTTMFAGASVGLLLAMRIAAPDESIVVAACYLVANAAAARSYRAGRYALEPALPRARVV